MNSMTLQAVVPNTMLDRSLLSEKVIVCCGEDENQMIAALTGAGAGEPRKVSSFRCYKVRKYTDYTVILAGIGTGSLEPLLHELLSFKIATKLVLVGTAGRLSGSSLPLGDVFIIKEAWLAGTALDREVKGGPLTPNFPLVLHSQSASIVSTDFYYGFTEAPVDDRYSRKLTHLKKDVVKFSHKADFVDMEVGQFYALCDLMLGDDSVQYIAIKGAANTLTDQNEQIERANEVLLKAFIKAFVILEINPDGDAKAALSAPAIASASVKSPGPTVKMMEEIKLYWLIQISSASVLGFLAAHLDLAKKDTTFLVCAPGFFLLTIGAVYNIVGNYYIRVEGVVAGLSSSQENVITPHLCTIYMFIGALLGGVMGCCLTGIGFIQRLPHAVGIATSLGALVGAFAIFYVQKKVFLKLYALGDSGYRVYGRTLMRIFGFPGLQMSEIRLRFFGTKR